MGRAQLPLFPLHTVLFPGGPLPLRVFEPRYLTMVSRCMREDSGFGVLLIREGTEIGRAATFDVGTVAGIVDWHQGSDGVLGVTAQGRQRFEVQATEQQADGLYLGTIRRIEAEPAIAVPGEYRFLTRLLRRGLDELGSLYRRIPVQYADSAWVGHRLTEILPLPLTVKQQSLEMHDPVARLGLLTPYARAECE